MNWASRLVDHCILLAQETAPTAEPNRWSMIVKHPVAWGVVLGAIAMWLMLPRGNAKGRGLGAMLGVVALACLASQLLPLGTWGSNVVFWILGGVTVVAAVCTVTFRSPVYCAVWFALTLVGTAAVFMLQGAQFLGVATVVVYAGAILVTFLFVLMLAQPKGNALYDRVSWEAMLAATTGAVLVGILTITIHKLDLKPTPDSQGVASTPLDRANGVLTTEHVAHLGAELFGRHLIAVEVAGTLLLVALIGATAIVSAQSRQSPATSARMASAPETTP